jgi:hypothetical protein
MSPGLLAAYGSGRPEVPSAHAVPKVTSRPRQVVGTPSGRRRAGPPECAGAARRVGQAGFRRRGLRRLSARAAGGPGRGCELRGHGESAAASASGGGRWRHRRGGRSNGGDHFCTGRACGRYSSRSNGHLTMVLEAPGDVPIPAQRPSRPDQPYGGAVDLLQVPGAVPLTPDGGRWAPSHGCAALGGARCPRRRPRWQADRLPRTTRGVGLAPGLPGPLVPGGRLRRPCRSARRPARSSTLGSKEDVDGRPGPPAGGEGKALNGPPSGLRSRRARSQLRLDQLAA